MHYRLGMVTLFVQDLPKAKAFYTGVLGLSEVPEFGGEQSALLQLASGIPLIIQDASRFPPGSIKPAGRVEIALQVDDVDAAGQDLKAKGVAVSEMEDVGVGRFFRLRDPEGHLRNISQ